MNSLKSTPIAICVAASLAAGFGIGTYLTRNGDLTIPGKSSNLANTNAKFQRPAAPGYWFTDFGFELPDEFGKEEIQCPDTIEHCFANADGSARVYFRHATWEFDEPETELSFRIRNNTYLSDAQYSQTYPDKYAYGGDFTAALADGGSGYFAGWKDGQSVFVIFDGVEWDGVPLWLGHTFASYTPQINPIAPLAETSVESAVPEETSPGQMPNRVSSKALGLGKISKSKNATYVKLYGFELPSQAIERSDCTEWWACYEIVLAPDKTVEVFIGYYGYCGGFDCGKWFAETAERKLSDFLEALDPDKVTVNYKHTFPDSFVAAGTTPSGASRYWGSWHDGTFIRWAYPKSAQHQVAEWIEHAYNSYQPEPPYCTGLPIDDNTLSLVADWVPGILPAHSQETEAALHTLCEARLANEPNWPNRIQETFSFAPNLSPNALSNITDLVAGTRFCRCD